ncbi:hypothetical protein QBC42DRAFT_349618 [Cladorrhinum samala]|uniref:Uncharacterized protein n=1 Tax=Cladorrhinum samala TaxID=585594 RepID=A0AAV9HBJ9_9PEZI|nr:hypothetical protein QBC42DRAFT_349618 [Cladorrhinum samala]
MSDHPQETPLPPTNKSLEPPALHPAPIPPSHNDLADSGNLSPHDQEEEEEDHPDDDDDDDDAAMRAALGFSSFTSTTRPAKRQRFNDPQASSASSSNLVPINHLARSAQKSQPLAASSSQDGTTNLELLNSNPASSSLENGSSLPIVGTNTNHPLSLPPRPQNTGFGPGRGRDQRGGGGGGGAGPSGHDKEWYKTYYDPSSNENPWWWLENSLGLKSEADDWLEFSPKGKGRGNPRDGGVESRSERFAGAAGIVAGFVGADDGGEE